MKIRNLNFNVKTSGAGVPFVWAHGLLGSLAIEDRLDWFQWTTFPPNVRLVRYDARGHGQSQASHKPDDYHWRNLGQDMLAVADAVDERYFIAGGASMGCATALYAALQAPGRIQGLVLAIPPTAWEKRAPQRERYQRMARLGGLLGGRLLARTASGKLDELLPPWMIAAEPEKIQATNAALAAMNGRTLASLLRGAALTDLPVRDALASLREIPTLILAWVDDPVHPVGSAEELHRLLPKSELYIAKDYADFKTLPQRMRRFILTTIHYQPPPIY